MPFNSVICDNEYMMTMTMMMLLHYIPINSVICDKEYMMMMAMTMMMWLQDMPVISVLYDNEYDDDDNYAAGYARHKCPLWQWVRWRWQLCCRICPSSVSSAAPTSTPSSELASGWRWLVSDDPFEGYGFDPISVVIREDSPWFLLFRHYSFFLIKQLLPHTPSGWRSLDKILYFIDLTIWSIGTSAHPGGIEGRE